MHRLGDDMMSDEATVIVGPEGLTIYDVEDFREVLLQAVTRSANVALDLSATEEADVLGFQLIHAARQLAMANRKTFRLAGVSEALVTEAKTLGIDLAELGAGGPR